MSVTTPEIIPTQLLEAIRGGRVVLFLGAGASMEANSADGSSPPSAKQLAKNLSEKFLGEDLGDFGLLRVASIASDTCGQNVVFEHIRSQLKTFRPSPAHKLIPTFRWHTIATTNYDTLIEDAYGEAEQPLQDLLPFVKDAEPIEMKKSDVLRPLVYLKLHGCIEHAHDPEIPLILDSAHYERYRTNRERLFDRLLDYAHELPFLFIGYSLEDPHIESLIYRLNQKGTRPEYYVVTPNIPEAIRRHWRPQRIIAIDATFGDLMATLDEAIPEPWRRIETRKSDHSQPIQKHFKRESDLSESLLKSLESDLMHVHPLMPTEEQSAQDFYRGYDRGFAAIASNFDADRRVSNDLILQLIDDQSSSKVNFYLLRGAAGTGKTVALKRIAWDIAKHFSVPVFWFRENGCLRHQVIRELYDLIGERMYLVIDRAVEHLAEIEEVMQVASAHRIKLSIISAERDSTWNVEKNSFDSRRSVQPYSIGQLVKPEIEELIKRLEAHSALGVLKSLSAQERVQAFEEADRHLLVALHEVTHGKPFEEIVIDECRSLSPQEAQQIYLDICTLNQFGAPVRAGVINRITGIPFSEYEEKFFMPLQEVVFTEDNYYSGDYEYRSRHPKVASLVFKQAFPEDQDRTNQLNRIIECLDEGYNADRNALSRLIKARNLIELLADVDRGRQVYACVQNLLPNRWYVHHQQANFELHHDHGSLEKAEDEGQMALELEPKRASVLHTLAEISRARAKKELDGLRKDIYRKQAHERLNNIKKNHSGFADGSRCRLHLDEMRDALKSVNTEDDASVSMLVEKSKLVQQEISKAISRHPADPDIIRLQADYYRILKDDEKVRVALEQAWEKSPREPSIGLQLARIYGGRNNPQKAQAILEEALERHSQDPMVNLEMAFHYMREKTKVERAGYHLGRSYRSGDRNYAARYIHAQYLFYTNEGDRSAKLFDETDQYAPPDYHPRSSYKVSVVSDLIGRVNGRVVKREESFSFLQIPTYPRHLYANISNSDADSWKHMRNQANVNFKIGFNRAGPVGLDLRVN